MGAHDLKVGDRVKSCYGSRDGVIIRIVVGDDECRLAPYAWVENKDTSDLWDAFLSDLEQCS